MLDKNETTTATQLLPRIDIDALPDHFELLETEVANALNLKLGTLRVWRARRIGIPFRKYNGRHVRYRVGDVKAYRASTRKTIEITEAHTGRKQKAQLDLRDGMRELFGEP